jgi:Na+/proline symporter
MEPLTYVILGLIILFPVLCFLYQLKKIPPIKSTSEFFLADKKIKSNEFLDTTVAYAYQIAAISLFASWGYVYGFWTIWVPIFWGVGFWFLKILNDKGVLKKYIKSNSTLSIHGFLAKKYRSKRVAQIAAIASLLGLSGTAFFEAEFTSNIIISACAPNNSLHLFFILFSVFVLVALIYIIVGGFKAVVATDKIQLSFGFISISLFIVITYIKVINNGYLYTGLILFLLTFFGLLFLNILYGKFKDINPSVFPKRISTTLFVSLTIFVIGGVMIIYNIFHGIEIRDSFVFFFREQKCGKIFSLGLLPMFSLLLANSLWQIVDISNWQRLASLDFDDDTQPILSKTLSFISWYSPITWLVAIFFGMSLRYVGFDVPDAWTALQKIAFESFQSKNIFDNFYILIFIFGMISIMYSTLDSLISSISYTTYYDIILKGNIEESAKLSKARMWTIVYTAIFFVLYLFIRYFVDGVDKILYTFYSFQLALFPAIISVFVNKKLNVLSAYLSIIFGGLFCLIPLFIDNETINPYSASAVFSVIGSIIVYIIFSFNSKYNINNM